MEEISARAESAEQDNPKPSTHHTGPNSCKGNRYLGVIVFWSLLGVLLLTRFVTHGVHYFIMIEERDSLNANLSTVSKKLAVMSEERDLLRANLSENLNEFERLLSLYKQKKTCPVGWSSFSHSCYLLSESFGSWDAARKDCKDRGADLVVIDSAEEQTFLSTITTKDAWIGLNDKEQEGTWKWVDGTPLTLTYWAKTQPDNGGKQDCAYVTKDERRSWGDGWCLIEYRQWICEKTPNPRWSSFNHSCYLLSESFGSWDAARRDCRGREADLVVINSPEEQNLLSKITTEVWIGLNDKEQEGTWKWVDGTPLNVTYWASGQPDNGGEEDCAHVIWDKQKFWNDLSCSSSRHWICEKVSENN
ncbi:C-type lectin domain family 17, member A-like isoform X2 [Oreochromis aureus]|uniref:C-type lectin domain family 17, member A-like isoform X2 n=1 Tax=Oreochromis aureus TaxID=47969 RepID=UPI001953FF2E|nr:C-type lectin domain family 17, member A-like isoform X2 [Oreochromis aureus]